VGSTALRSNRAAQRAQGHHLADAALYITKLPKVEQQAPARQTAAEVLMLIGERGYAAYGSIFAILVKCWRTMAAAAAQRRSGR
jgi:hypothetical protein